MEKVLFEGKTYNETTSKGIFHRFKILLHEKTNLTGPEYFYVTEEYIRLVYHDKEVKILYDDICDLFYDEDTDQIIINENKELAKTGKHEFKNTKEYSLNSIENSEEIYKTILRLSGLHEEMTKEESEARLKRIMAKNR